MRNGRRFGKNITNGGKEDTNWDGISQESSDKKSGRPAKAATKVSQATVAEAPQKNAFEEKFGEGTAFDLDYGKLLIIALCVYIAVQVS